MLCICWCIIYFPSQNWGRLCSFPWGVHREPGAQPSQLTHHWPGGYSIPWNAMSSAWTGGADWEGTITAGGFKYWASLIFPVVFLCLFPFHYNYYYILFCFNYENAFSPVLIPTLGGEVKPQQTEGYFCLQLCYSQTSPLASPCHLWQDFFHINQERNQEIHWGFQFIFQLCIKYLRISIHLVNKELW